MTTAEQGFNLWTPLHIPDKGARERNLSYWGKWLWPSRLCFLPPKKRWLSMQLMVELRRGSTESTHPLTGSLASPLAERPTSDGGSHRVTPCQKEALLQLASEIRKLERNSIVAGSSTPCVWRHVALAPCLADLTTRTKKNPGFPSELHLKMKVSPVEEEIRQAYLFPFLASGKESVS